MSTVTIRQARSDDAATIAEYNRRLALESEHLDLDPAVLLPGVLAALDPDNPARYYVAEAEGAIVGQLMVTYEWSDWRNGVIWWLQSVYVHQDWRKSGVFRQLFETVQAAAREEGALGFRLYVEQQNTGAQAVYAKLGFQPSAYVVWEALE